MRDLPAHRLEAVVGDDLGAWKSEPGIGLASFRWISIQAQVAVMVTEISAMK
jgi:hypothetical protein